MALINGISEEPVLQKVFGNIGNTLKQHVNNIKAQATTPIEDSIPTQTTTPIEDSTTTKKTPFEMVKELVEKHKKEQEQEQNKFKSPFETIKEMAEQAKQEKQEEQEEKGTLPPQEQVTVDQEKLWEREDQIRKETQEREDNAYQRMVEDMRKAGINPNLINISGNGSASGGGITSATPKESIQGTLISSALQKALKEIEQSFEKGENTKDRVTDIFNTLERTIGSIITLSFLKG